MPNRRDFLKVFGGSLASVYFGGCTSALKKDSFEWLSGSESDHFISTFSPIQRHIPNKAPLSFSGDQPDQAHSILWNKEKFISSIGGKLPKPTRHVDVAVVGGGISGLMSAYFLR